MQFSRADNGVRVASRMPSQVAMRIAEFATAESGTRSRAQQAGGAMKEAAGWPKGRRPV
jgi:hypothetical protein